jgi:hypothetical protein
MLLKKIWLFGLLACPVFLKAQTIKPDDYVAANIPDSLRVNANSVVRYSMESTEVDRVGHYSQSFHSIITILNNRGDDEAVWQIAYNRKYDNISGLEICVYDAQGKLLKKYHKSDMYDRLAIDDETLATNERVLLLEHTVSSYPQTVEIKYEQSSDNYIDLGSWHPQAPQQAVQQSYCMFKVKTDMGFRYYSRNIKLSTTKTSKDNLDTYTWVASGLKALKTEKGSQSWQYTPALRFAIDKFVCYDYAGSIATWNDFAHFQAGLNYGINELSPERKAEIQQMTANLKTDKEKAEFLYHYLQKTQRYISVQLGIGGLKPFAASFVDQKIWRLQSTIQLHVCLA